MSFVSYNFFASYLIQNTLIYASCSYKSRQMKSEYVVRSNCYHREVINSLENMGYWYHHYILFCQNPFILCISSSLYSCSSFKVCGEPIFHLMPPPEYLISQILTLEWMQKYDLWSFDPATELCCQADVLFLVKVQYLGI